MFYPPQDPQYFPAMAYMDHQLYLQVSSETRKRFDPQYFPGINTQPYLRVPSETWEKHYHHMSLSQTVNVWQKMLYFCDNIEVFTPPPNPQYLPEMAYMGPLRHRKKIDLHMKF